MSVLTAARRSFAVNFDEVNMVAVAPGGTALAAVDDTGDAALIDLTWRQQELEQRKQAGSGTGGADEGGSGGGGGEQGRGRGKDRKSTRLNSSHW